MTAPWVGSTHSVLDFLVFASFFARSGSSTVATLAYAYKSKVQLKLSLLTLWRFLFYGWN